MSRRGLLFSVLFALILVLPATVPAQEAGAPGTPVMGPPPQMKEIAGMAGVWTVAFDYKLDPMAEEWTSTQALATIKNVLDGAAQQMDYSGEIMGTKFNGIGFTTYDRETAMWQNSWVDNLTGRISLYTGEMKDEKLVFNGMELSQGMSFHARQTVFNITEDRFEYLMEMSMDGETYLPTGRAVYTRRP